MKNYIKPSLILVVLIVLGTFVFVGAQQNQNNFNQGTGSGSGTVSPNNGSAGAVANYAAAGGSTTVGPDANLVDAANLLTYSGTSGILASAGPVASGANGGAAGVGKLFGSTSGFVTLTAPAVAGTLTNPLAVSNVLATADGSTAAAAYGFSGQTGVGMFRNASNDLRLTTASDGSNHTTIALLDGTGIFVGTTAFFVGTGANPAKASLSSGVALGWTANNASPSVASDVAFSRQGVNMLALGNGTVNDETGQLRSGNTCRITADVSLTVNVANSFCSFSLPAVAKPWAFSCNIQWAISAGSGTNNFALGVNPSQTPTGTTNGEAQIYTAAPANTSTMGSAAISASGATTILTGATYTPAATVQFANISGTLLASGTAGTFAIQATANGTTATAAVKAGSSCQIF